MIYTDGLESQVLLSDNLPTNASFIRGIVHNHTGFDSVSRADINFYSYPSADDWQTADVLIGKGASAADFSIWMISPDGALREFKYSDKDYYSGLSDEQKKDGEGLPESSTVQGCEQ
jgi:hypothetical protein